MSGFAYTHVMFLTHFLRFSLIFSLWVCWSPRFYSFYEICLKIILTHPLHLSPLINTWNEAWMGSFRFLLFLLCFAVHPLFRVPIHIMHQISHLCLKRKGIAGDWFSVLGHEKLQLNIVLGLAILTRIFLREIRRRTLSLFFRSFWWCLLLSILPPCPSTPKWDKA